MEKVGWDDRTILVVIIIVVVVIQVTRSNLRVKGETTPSACMLDRKSVV